MQNTREMYEKNIVWVPNNSARAREDREGAVKLGPGRGTCVRHTMARAFSQHALDGGIKISRGTPNDAR
jgi:hypothetical protein